MYENHTKNGSLIRSRFPDALLGQNRRHFDSEYKKNRGFLDAVTYH